MPIDVLQVPLLACANESDWDHLGFAPVLENVSPASAGIEIGPSNQAATPHDLAIHACRFDELADEPGRKHRRCYASRDAAAIVRCDRRRSQGEARAGIEASHVLQKPLEPACQPLLSDRRKGIASRHVPKLKASNHDRPRG